MLGFIHGIQTSLISVGVGVAHSGRGAARQRHVTLIRRTSEGSMRKVLAALRVARGERDALAAENALLRRENDRLRRLTSRH